MELLRLQKKKLSPIVEMLTLAAPTVAQMASYTITQFIDTWMLSRLGGTEPTAVSNSGMMAFSVLSFGMGVTFIVSTFCCAAELCNEITAPSSVRNRLIPFCRAT